MIEDMPKPRKPYIHRDIARHGNVRWYFRCSLKSPRIRIRGAFGSPEFETAYDAALAGQPVEAATAAWHPLECVRLQGFDDDCFSSPRLNKPFADGPIYKMLGNSFAVNVVRWLGEGIQSVVTPTQKGQ